MNIFDENAEVCIFWIIVILSEFWVQFWHLLHTDWPHQTFFVFLAMYSPELSISLSNLLLNLMTIFRIFQGYNSWDFGSKMRKIWSLSVHMNIKFTKMRCSALEKFATIHSTMSWQTFYQCNQRNMNAYKVLQCIMSLIIELHVNETITVLCWIMSTNVDVWPVGGRQILFTLKPNISYFRQFETVSLTFYDKWSMHRTWSGKV